jgi:succinyl-CoA synthetase alpha subunit
MSIFADKNTRVLIQGITGTQASFHAKRSLDCGTKVVAGTSPHHYGEEHLGLPVFDNVRQAMQSVDFDASVLFVPAMAVKKAAREAIEAEVPLIVSIAQGVPVHDMLEIKAMLNGAKTIMIGPNTPGLITPQEARLGIFPENIHHKGCIGIVSRASTLTYEAVIEANMAGLGQSTVIGLGDDMVIGTDYREPIRRFMNDDETKAVILVGKADNLYEQAAADEYSKSATKKPVIAVVAGETLPFGHSVGYAGDIITNGKITVQDKKKMMRDAGMIVVDSISKVHHTLKELHLAD